MRANNEGRIIQCSSIFGFVSAHYRGAYNASKYAVEALSDAMRQELRDTNIKVAIIEPGPIRTEFVPRCLQAYEEHIDTENSPHKESYKKRINSMKKGGTDKFKLEPDIVVDKLIHALTSKNPKIRYYVTIPTYFMAYAKRFLPAKMIDNILINN
jgi:short-subunit dehydrogenase